MGMLPGSLEPGIDFQCSIFWVNSQEKREIMSQSRETHQFIVLLEPLIQSVFPDECSIPVFFEGLGKFLVGVHDDRTLPCNRVP